MLTSLDESMLHQTPTTFDHAATSDHRFYDRHYVEAVARDGSMAIAAGVGLYKNTNVFDGFVTVVHEDVQHNLRLSRSLRPDVGTPAVGPLRYEVVRPLRSMRLVVEPGEHAIAADVYWEAAIAPIEEIQHFTRTDGRVQEEVHRYNQSGRAHGFVEVRGHRVEFDDWWAARDHSWGVRPNTGGFEPRTSAAPPPAILEGFLYTWFAFSTDEFNGYVQVHENGKGERVVFDGLFRWPEEAGRPDLRVTDVEYEFSFNSTPRLYDAARVQVTTGDGQKWEIDCGRLLPPFVMRGTGYDSGYDDGRGVGAFRGDFLVEEDAYDLSQPAVPRVLPGGDVLPHFHREQLVEVRVNGQPGLGHLTCIPVGALPKYGIPPFSAEEFQTLAKITGGRDR